MKKSSYFYVQWSFWLPLPYGFLLNANLPMALQPGQR